jgi:hypothetical protein
MKNLIQKIFKKEQDPLSSEERLKIVEESSQLVGPGLFYRYFYLREWKANCSVPWLGQNP